MARAKKFLDRAAIDARRDSLRAELAMLDEQVKAAEEAARDAGRAVLLSALERIKVAQLNKADARVIATAIERHGGSAIAAYIAMMPAS